MVRSSKRPSFREADEDDKTQRRTSSLGAVGLVREGVHRRFSDESQQFTKGHERQPTPDPESTISESSIDPWLLEYLQKFVPDPSVLTKDQAEVLLNMCKEIEEEESRLGPEFSVKGIHTYS
eukprot:Trichotokara_eunicae@DN7765_c0_g1_i1.p1